MSISDLHLIPLFTVSISLFLIFISVILFKKYRSHKNEILQLQERFRDFAESAYDCFWEMDETLRFTYHSSTSSKKGADAPLVSTSSRIIGKTRWENAGLQDPQQDPKWKKHHADLLDKKPFRDFIYTYRREDLNNRLVVSRTSGKPVFDKDGNFKGYRGTATDITTEYELRKVQEESSKRLLQDMDSLSEGFSIWDSSMKLLSFNEQFDFILAAFSIKPHEGMMLSDFIQMIKSSKLVREAYHDELYDFLKNIQENTKSSQSSLVLELTSGKRFLLRIGTNSLNEKIITITDINILKEKEVELLHLQKMEILGQITGGVAHDFNNLLAIILGNLELLKKHITADTTEKIFKNAERGAQRAAYLTQRLLAFARRQNLQPEVMSIQESIDSISDLLKSSLGGSITLNIKVSDDVCDIFVDMPQLETALLNLAVNSKDAMPNGGQFSIYIERMNISPDQIKSLGLKKPGEHLLIACSDTGLGMNKEVLKNATEPFYTTKEKEKGSGLGLSMVYGFVRQSGGGFKISSIPYIGTTVSMYFPKAQDTDYKHKPGETRKQNPRELYRSPNNEVILVVEDTPEILELTCDILADLGYTIIKAHDSKLALQILETETKIDLLLSDIILPGGMNGFELANIAIEMRKNLTVLFMTGYTPVDPNKYFEDTITVIKKPFTEFELSEKVFETITSKKRPINLKDATQKISNY